jgi:hypothetical protein
VVCEGGLIGLLQPSLPVRTYTYIYMEEQNRGVKAVSHTVRITEHKSKNIKSWYSAAQDTSYITDNM